MTGLTLLIPEKSDTERDAVAEAWLTAGGKAVRVDRFWEAPPIDPATVRLYGFDTFCLRSFYMETFRPSRSTKERET